MIVDQSERKQPPSPLLRQSGMDVRTRCGIAMSTLASVAALLSVDLVVRQCLPAMNVCSNAHTPRFRERHMLRVAHSRFGLQDGSNKTSRLTRWHVGWQADVAFEAVEALQGLPRAVYGLLRSPLLVRRAGQHADGSTAARLLWCKLPPADLRLAVYPLLSSYTSPDAQVPLPP